MIRGSTGLRFGMQNEGITDMTKPTSILLVLALCGCDRVPDDRPAVSVGPKGCSDTTCMHHVEIDGIQCIAARSHGTPIGGLSCDWIGYHQRQPERQPPDAEAIDTCLMALDPNSNQLTETRCDRE